MTSRRWILPTAAPLSTTTQGGRLHAASPRSADKGRRRGAGKPIGIESIEGVTFATTPSGLFSWGTQNSPEWLLKRNVVSIALAAAESASASDAAQDKELDGKMLKYGKGKTHDGEDMGFYFRSHDEDACRIRGPRHGNDAWRRECPVHPQRLQGRRRCNSFPITSRS